MGSQVRAQCYLLAGDLGQGSYSLRLHLLICEMGDNNGIAHRAVGEFITAQHTEQYLAHRSY